MFFARWSTVQDKKVRPISQWGIFQSRWCPFFLLILMASGTGMSIFRCRNWAAPAVSLVKAPINRTGKKPLPTGRWGLQADIHHRPMAISQGSIKGRWGGRGEDLYCLLDGLLSSQCSHSLFPHWKFGVAGRGTRHPRVMLSGFYFTNFKYLSDFLL